MSNQPEVLRQTQEESEVGWRAREDRGSGVAP